MIVALALTALAADPLDEQPLPEERRRVPRVVLPPLPRQGTAAFRTLMPAGGHAFGSRLALVKDLDGPTIGELTLRGQLAWRSFSVSVEVAGTAAGSELWTGVGLGNTVVDIRGILGRKVTHTLGIQLSLATGYLQGTPEGAVAWWGTVGAATVPNNAIALAYEGATARWVWHIHAGPDFSSWDYTFVDAGTSVATVQPVAPGWSVVAEGELLYDPSPLHLRGLVRRELGAGWSADLGLALPIVEFVAEPSLQVLGQVQRHW